MVNLLFILFLILCLIVLGICCYRISLTAKQANKTFKDLSDRIPVLIKEERKKAVESSRAVLKGKISEEVLPLLPNFPYQASDMKFFGSPIDFIIFDGMSDGEVKEIILLDVKTGNARLTNIQKQIKLAVENKAVSWRTYNG